MPNMTQTVLKVLVSFVKHEFRHIQSFWKSLDFIFHVHTAALGNSPIVISSMGFWMSLYYIWWFVIVNSVILFWIMIINVNG